MWLSTDPLSGYNPVFETEHYIDGQHNGGVFNSFYGYTYQNPIRYIDPNGKQVEWEKVWNNTKTFFKNVGEVTHKIAKNLAPIRPANVQEQKKLDLKYGKSDGNPINDLKRVWSQIKDVPEDISSSIEGLSSLDWETLQEKFINSSTKEQAEMLGALGVVGLSLRKGKVDTKFNFVR